MQRPTQPTPFSVQRNNRRFPRVPSEHAVLLRLLGGQPFEEFARTKVISPGGCMLVSRESLGYSTLMELLIAVKRRVIKTDARVAWEVRKDDSDYQVGIEFLRISPADRAFLESLVTPG
jgi:hypothetical protein